MKLRLGAITAVLCLVGAGTAYAAGPVTGGPNTYTGNFAVSGGAGTAKKPVAVGVTETLGMGSTTANNVGAPLVDIKTSLYGLKSPNAKLFPTCTANKINANGTSGKWNTACAKGSLIASGHISAALVSPTVNLVGPGAPCSLGVSVYNSGPGKMTFFLTTTPSLCDGNQTGSAAAWTAKVYQAGANLVIDDPEPADVSYNAGGLGLFGSLQSETLNFKKLSVKKAGKVYPFIESTGCKSHARPFTIAYTATESTSGSPTVGTGTVTGSANC